MSRPPAHFEKAVKYMYRLSVCTTYVSKSVQLKNTFELNWLAFMRLKKSPAAKNEKFKKHSSTAQMCFQSMIGNNHSRQLKAHLCCTFEFLVLVTITVCMGRVNK